MKVMTFGTFDILHSGHVFYLKEAKKYGDVLGVVVARDENVRKIKGRNPRNNEEKRLRAIKNLDYVDEVFLGDKKDKYRVIKEFQPDIVCLGYDQNVEPNKLEKSLKKEGIEAEVFKIKSFKPDIYKSSKLK